MNKVIWWIVGIIVVVIGIYYFVSNKPDTAADDVVPATEDGQGSFTTPSDDQGAPADTSGKSLKDLIALGVSQQCAFSQTVDNSSTSGTVFVGMGKMRGDFVSVASGQTVNAHMIADGQYTYTWIDGIAMGFKMSLDQTAPASGTGANQTGSPDLNQKLDYNCSAWTLDASKFTLPAGVTFTAMGSAGLMTPPTQ